MTQQAPRQKNAQVVILSLDSDEPFVLLQLRSYDMPVMPGHLATVGGMRDAGDRDSAATAVREVFEETGLLDVGLLEQASGSLRSRAVKAGAVSPQAFFKFAEGANVDWWALLLDGPGSFGPALDTCECADITAVLPELPGAEPAPCFGHAWVPAARTREFGAAVPLMGGLVRRIDEALAAVEAFRAEGAGSMSGALA